MQYPEQYRTELLNTLKSIDLAAIDQILEIFREARAHGRCIFVCGGGSNAVAASRLLCDTVRSSNVNRTKKFRIFALSDDLSPASVSRDDLSNEQVLADELRNVASTGDVVVGINTSGNSRSVLRAFQYAREIGCRTICIAGKGGGKLAAISDTAVLVPASQPANVDDTHMIVCRMIGQYFVNFDQE